ncbi:hypothetical protein PENSPDRAFT_593227, partial [Peniophora sp. CONT]
MCKHGIITGGLGTIKDPKDPKKGGTLSGFLKQEFRELELLNEITRLRWEGNLKAGVGGNTRSTLLKSYIKVYGRKKCPDMVHTALSWGKPGEEDLTVDYDDDPAFVWKNVDKPTAKADPGSLDDIQKGKESTGRKRKHGELENEPKTKLDVIPPAAKKRKTSTRSQMMRGSIWNQRTQTCAYDTILSILSNVYFHNAHRWHESMGGINALMQEMVQEW